MSIDSKEDMIKGKTNQAVGKVTNDDKKELKGEIQEKVAQAKEKGEDVIDKVAKKVNKKNDSK